MGMTIKRRIKINGKYLKHETLINSVDDFIEYYNLEKESDSFISFPEEVNFALTEMISQSKEVNHKQIIKSISKMIASPRFKTNINYWICRGWDENTAKNKVSELQRSSSNAFAKKRKLNPELYNNITPNQIQYWIDRGYSIKDAKDKVSERQSTFSYDKCIEKYGPEQGKIVFNRRQEKWIQSIENSEGSSWSYSDRGLSNEMYIKRYGDQWINIKIEHLKKRKSTNIETLEQLNLIKDYVNDKEGLYLFLMSCDFNQILGLSNNTVVHTILECNNHIEIKSKWCEFNNVDKIDMTGAYGNMYYYKNKFYKSNGEFLIGKYLEENNIEFTNNTKYPGTHKYCDFYVIKLDLYIEYMGMSNDTYEDKIKLLSKRPYKILWSNNEHHIIKIIDEKIHKLN